MERVAVTLGRTEDMGGKQRAMGKKMGKRMKSLFGLRGVLGVLFLWPGTAILAGMQDGGSASSANRIEDSNPESVSTNGDYRIGPGDVIVVSVWKEPEASSTVVIRPDGKISLPLVNDLSVDGKTPMEVQKIISEKLAPFIKSPNVTVTVQEIYSKKVFVLGEVNRAGAYQITQPMTVLQVLTEAQGLRPFANQKAIYVLRTENGKQVRLPFNYKDVVQGKKIEQNVLLHPGDTVVVP